MTLQIGAERSLLIGRNRKDFMKGVKSAGEFRNLSTTNPELAKIARPDMEGTVLDGELTETYLSDGSVDETTRVRKEEGLFTGFTVWTVLFLCGVDVRGRSEASRRELTVGVVERLNHPKIRLIERVPATMENLQAFFDRGEEGAIAKKLTAGIPIGRRTNRLGGRSRAIRTARLMPLSLGCRSRRVVGPGSRGSSERRTGRPPRSRLR